MKPKLSICIPTYNRAKEIIQTLDSIISQNVSDIEVIVLDNASNDNSIELINKHIINHEFIKLYQNETNIGPDRNFLRVTQFASGEYIWLLSSDDTIVKGGLDYVLKNIYLHHPELLLIGYNLCDYTLQVIRKAPEFDVKDDIEICATATNEGRSFFINKVNGWGTGLGYLSNVVFNKKCWFINYTIGEQYVGTAFSFSAILLTMIINGCNLMYINTPIVNYRSDNDSFVKNPLKRWVFLILDGYFLLSKIIVDQKQKECFLAKVRALVPVKTIVGVYILTDDRQIQRDKLLELIYKLGYSKSDALIMKIATLNLVSNIINYLRKVKHAFS